MRALRFAIVIISSLLLFACQTIEHRSEVVTKAPLPALSHDRINPRLLWTHAKSAGVGKAEAKLRLVVTDSNVVTIDYKGNIVVLDRPSGRLKSLYTTKTRFTAGPAVAEDRLFAGTDEGYIVAYRLTDGAFLWKAPVTGSILAAPLASHQVVFVHVLDDSVVALNAADGKQLWRYSVTIPPLMLRQGSSPALVDNHLIVGFANGSLKSLEKADGIVEWEREIAISKGRSDLQRMVDIGADPVVKDNVVYAVSYQGKLAAIELDTGTPLWEKELSAYSGLSVGKQQVFVADAHGVLWALSRKTGEILWKRPELSGRRLSAPAIIQDYIVVGDDDGYLHWIRQKDGAFVGRIMVDNKGIEAMPIVKENIAYVLGRSGKIATLTFSK